MIEVFSRRNASNVLPVMWTIGELGIDCIRHDIGGSFSGTRTTEYLEMNPNGRIPTIKDGSFTLWESNTIVRYLCRRYDKSGHLLPQSVEACALADQWMDWHKTTLYPPCIDLIWSTVRTEPAARDFGKIRRLQSATEEALAILDHQLGNSSHVLGDSLSMADIPLGAIYHRYMNLEIDRPGFERIDTWYRRLCRRPAYVEHVMFPFGTNPGEWYRLELQSS